MDAVFAGRLFVPGEQNGYRFYLWGDLRLPDGRHHEEGMVFSMTVAEPADGAFLCKLEKGWLFVVGVSKNSNFRHTFFDDSPQAEANALAMQRMGIPVLSTEEGNKRVLEDGLHLYSITADERQQAKKLADRTEE